MKKLWLMKSLFLALLLTSACRADQILAGTDLHTDVNGGLVIGDPGIRALQYAAQGFSVPSEVHISALQLVISVGGSSTQSFTLQLTSSLGPSTTIADIITESTIQADPLPLAGMGKLFVLSTSLNLAAGKYYLVLGSHDRFLAWPFYSLDGTQNVPLDGTFGMADSSFYSIQSNSAFPAGAANWNYNAGAGPVQFQVIGSPSPEPTTFGLLSIGLGGAAALWRRRCTLLQRYVWRAALSTCE